MTFFQCEKCLKIFEIKEGEGIPEKCPNCSEKCMLTDVTNYTDDYGGQGSIDQRLVKK